MPFGGWLTVGAGAVYIGGQIYGSYKAAEGAEAQADAARYAADQAAAASTEAARINADAAEQSAEIAADAMIRSGLMQAQVMRDGMEMQRQQFLAEMLQAQRLATRGELRMVVGMAAKDTFEKVSGAFVQWTQVNDIDQEQRMRAQFGLQDDVRFQAPPAPVDMSRMMTEDSLTGDRTADEGSQYRLSGDFDDMEGEGSLEPTPDATEGIPEELIPDGAEDIIDDLGP